MNDYTIRDTPTKKILISKHANYVFNKATGDMHSWRETLNDDPQEFPAPTILDFEVTTKCNGIGKDNKICRFCYKSNSPDGRNLSFENFKKIFDKLPKSITQIAFGVDSRCETNPDVFHMMLYAKDQGVIPNVTVAELDYITACKLASLCGAVAVSAYDDPDIFANTVQHLTDCELKQCNAHVMISEETYERSIRVIRQVSVDSRLKNLNAVVFLSLKTKGRGEHFHPLPQAKFNSLVNLCKENGISYGFDSCSSLKYFSSLSEHEYGTLSQYIQPCESTLESAYINVDGEFFPCSFTEGTEGWENGISVLDCNDFVEDVWEHERTQEFRNKLMSTVDTNKFQCRSCPIHKI